MTFNRQTHFNQHLDLEYGHHLPLTFPDDLIGDITQSLTSQGVPVATIRPQHVRNYLRSIRMRRWYGYSNLVAQRINGFRDFHPVHDPAIRTAVVNEFNRVSAAWNIISPRLNRRNFLPYPWVLAAILYRLDISPNPPSWNNPAKAANFVAAWALIVREMDSNVGDD